MDFLRPRFDLTGAIAESSVVVCWSWLISSECTSEACVLSFNLNEYNYWRKIVTLSSYKLCGDKVVVLVWLARFVNKFK